MMKPPNRDKTAMSGINGDAGYDATCPDRSAGIGKKAGFAL